ncbi:protein FAM189A2 isoform X1 [Larimichthys crocea]|uniref:protein FAM189A2 isoform X1 n=1 Tax=Larimichthys crocea TaxID=215358 RepID=UPI000F5F3855|nr:protein FAM189A2 isoform X1 [Larimichthys crocea]
MAAALRYLQIFTARTPCMDEPRATVEEREEPAQVPDPDEFVAPAPPPSYFSTFYSYTPRLARRMLGDSVIPLPHIYGARIKGVEVFCPLDPPPSYEAVAGSSTSAVTQETEIALTEMTMNSATSATGATVQVYKPHTTPEPTANTSSHCDGSSKPENPQELSCTDPSTSTPPLLPDKDMSAQTQSALAGVLPQFSHQPQSPPQQQHAPAVIPWRKPRIQRYNSDPVLMDLATKVQGSTPLAPSPQTTDSSTQTSQPTLAAHAQGHVTMRRGNNSRMPRRPRPSSMVDYQSYQHTQQLVRKILEQPAAQGLTPEVQELVDSIRTVLQSDQEHMEEAVRCASYIEQVFTDSDMCPSQPKPPQQQQPVGSSSQTFPRPPTRRPGLLHLQSCGDLSSFTCAAFEALEHRGNSRKTGSRAGSKAESRAGSRPGSRLDHPERPHSLIGVFRETVL